MRIKLLEEADKEKKETIDLYTYIIKKGKILYAGYFLKYKLIFLLSNFEYLHAIDNTIIKVYKFDTKGHGKLKIIIKKNESKSPR